MIREEGGDPVQMRGGGELGRELRLRETFLAELSRWNFDQQFIFRASSY